MNKYKAKLKQAKTIGRTKKEAHILNAVREAFKELGGVLGTDIGVFTADLEDRLMHRESISYSTSQRWVNTVNPFKSNHHGRTMVYLPSKIEEMAVKYGEVSTASKIASLASMLQDAVTMGEAIEEMEDMMYDENIIMAHESQVNALLGIICDTMDNNARRMDSLADRIHQVKNS